MSPFLSQGCEAVGLVGISCEGGRKLQGASIPLPDGFHFEQRRETGGGGGGGSSSNLWVSRGQFKNLTYWNHDSLPSSDDPLLRCFHWFSVADAVRNTFNVIILFIYAKKYLLVVEL
ncbi:unnamed protein product [Spirodela intermedia]|uniref:Uncharacterized protein n=1 Tax=Spirodela intermedia TaxID=51605 RepID=A0A7I8IJK3_SPIIN|nr:unnamed protein product [Spirodela intermedia]CAA6658067.1 unnamed protein product [Spirodela intermedia]